MTPLERLLAEELPTGAWGGPRTVAAAPETRRDPEIDPQAADHARELRAALQPQRRHLRVVGGVETGVRMAA